MRLQAVRLLVRLATPAAALLLAACAPAPIYKPAPGLVEVPPAQVARTPEQYGHAEVIWGGSVVRVSNFPDHSDVEILGYPLDGSQRPQVNDTGGGRFIAVVPGYVEPLSYPQGTLVTLKGRIQGVRAGQVGKADYVFPLVAVQSLHKWTPEELQDGRSRVHFGVGVGVGIH